MTIEEVITRLDSIASDHYPIITDSDIEALKIAMNIIKEKKLITEREQKINKSAMMQEIYMQGVNLTGEYQGCWVRFKNIEKIVDRYVR